jgi:hypothetical protein
MTWAEDDSDWAWLDDLLATVRVERRAVTRPFAYVDDVVALLQGAGLGRAAVHRFELKIHFADAAQWWRLLWSCSSRGALEQLSAVQVEALRRAATPHLTAMRRAGPLNMRLVANIVLARRLSGSR